MFCERCHERPATVHFTQIVNNHKTEMHLCEVCAQEVQGLKWSLNPQSTLHNFLAGLMNPFGGAPFQVTHEKVRTCPNCGISEGQFVQKGLLGCSECYKTFADRLQPLVRRIHGSSQHTGKVPARTGGKARLTKEINKLKEALQQAVQKENFEEAARLRDQIRDLEKEL